MFFFFFKQISFSYAMLVFSNIEQTFYFFCHFESASNFVIMVLVSAQRLERLRKERQNQIKCKNIQWKERSSSQSGKCYWPFLKGQYYITFNSFSSVFVWMSVYTFIVKLYFAHLGSISGSIVLSSTMDGGRWLPTRRHSFEVLGSNLNSGLPCVKFAS